MKVLFLLNFGFPNGMASASRARLYALALKEGGVDVEVSALRYPDKFTPEENHFSKGEYQGIKFDYATETSKRPNSFLARRYAEFLSYRNTILRLSPIKNNRDYDCVFYYGNMIDKNITLSFYNKAIDFLKVPHAIELCERPWQLESSLNTWPYNYSPLKYAKGCIPISSYLEDWAKKEANRLHQQLKIFRVPILVDLHEFKYERNVSKVPTVMFAGAPSYSSSIKFILEAMNHVWEKVPQSKLVITGCSFDSPVVKWLMNELGEKKFKNGIVLKGYLSREELIKELYMSWALLAPLFDDIRSKARFPTKIGEYLATSAPVISNNVGEVDVYLQDEINAYLSPPGDALAYAEKIIKALTHFDEAEKLGKQGRIVAEKYFDYRKYSSCLAKFFSDL